MLPLLQARHKVAKFDSQQGPVECPSRSPGKSVLLTRLCKGQRATVLQLPARPRVNVDDANDSTVATPVVASLIARAD